MPIFEHKNSIDIIRHEAKRLKNNLKIVYFKINVSNNLTE